MEGGIGHANAPNGLGTAMCAEYYMATNTMWPYYLGCEQLLSRFFASSSHNSVCSSVALGGITSYPAPLIHGPGEYDSQNPPAINIPRVFY